MSCIAGFLGVPPRFAWGRAAAGFAGAPSRLWRDRPLRGALRILHAGRRRRRPIQNALRPPPGNLTSLHLSPPLPLLCPYPVLVRPQLLR